MVIFVGFNSDWGLPHSCCVLRFWKWRNHTHHSLNFEDILYMSCMYLVYTTYHWSVGRVFQGSITAASAQPSCQQLQMHLHKLAVSCHQQPDVRLVVLQNASMSSAGVATLVSSALLVLVKQSGLSCTSPLLLPFIYIIAFIASEISM